MRPEGKNQPITQRPSSGAQPQSTEQKLARGVRTKPRQRVAGQPEHLGDERNRRRRGKNDTIIESFWDVIRVGWELLTAADSLRCRRWMDQSQEVAQKPRDLSW